MKFLILLLFFTLNAFAASGVNQNWSIAGNPLTSKNLANGSFESGTNTGWTVSAGTLTATTAQAIQGMASGLWTITGAGTIDLCATPTGLVSTDLLASGWVKSTSTDLQVCSVANSVENGCTPLGTATGWKKVTASATYASGNFCFRLKSVASGAITAYVDDVKLEPLENQQVSTVTQEAANYTGNGGGSITAGLPVQFNTIVASSLNTLGTWSGTVYTAKVKQQVKVDGTIRTSATATGSPYVYATLSGVAKIISRSTYVANGLVFAFDGNVELNAGDTLYMTHDATLTLTNVADHVISITATAVRDNVIASYQDGTEWTSFTPTGSWTTNTTYTGKWQREKDKAVIQYNITLSGAPTSGTLILNPPSGLVIDGTKLLTNTLPSRGELRDVSTGVVDGVLATYNGSGGIFLTYTQAGSLYDSVVSNTAPVTLVSGDSISVKVEVPIQGWSSLPALIALPTRSEIFSANVSIAGAVTNATQNFVTSCTNATPSVCTLWSNFGVTPICWSTPVDITKRAEVTTTSTTSLTVGRTDTSTAFNLFCHLK